MKPKETLSARLACALKHLNMTQSELARRIGVKQQVIQYLCTSQAQKSKFTYAIAQALGVNDVWLASGKGSMSLTDDPHYALIQSQIKIPLLTWEQIKLRKQHTEKLDLSSHKDWLLVSNNTHAESFAFQLKDKSMYPRFDENTIIIINTERQPQHKDFVIIYIKSQDDILFRQLLIENGTPCLYSMNTTLYNSYSPKTDDVIIGTMEEARWYS